MWLQGSSSFGHSSKFRPMDGILVVYVPDETTFALSDGPYQRLWFGSEYGRAMIQGSFIHTF